MKSLFLDCFSGISGDMTVGALVDLGVKPSALEWELSKLDLGDFHMHFGREQRQHIEGVKFGIHEGATHTHGQDEPAHHDCCDHGPNTAMSTGTATNTKNITTPITSTPGTTTIMPTTTSTARRCMAMNITTTDAATARFAR